MKMKYKIGDQVVFENPMFVGVGEIIYISEASDMAYGVLSKDISNGHNLSAFYESFMVALGRGSRNNCGWFRESELRLFTKVQKQPNVDLLKLQAELLKISNDINKIVDMLGGK